MNNNAVLKESITTINRNDIRQLMDRHYIIIDIETTGLNPNWHKITEIAAIKVSNGEVVDTFQSLIKPYSRSQKNLGTNRKGVYIDQKITDLTGITEDMLMNAPSIKRVLSEFQSFIQDDPLVGHNINFDLSFLNKDFKRFLKTPITNDFVDTLELSRNLIKGVRNHKLDTLVHYFKIKVVGSHRALADCEATLGIYKALCQTVPKK